MKIREGEDVYNARRCREIKKYNMYICVDLLPLVQHCCQRLHVVVRQIDNIREMIDWTQNSNKLTNME